MEEVVVVVRIYGRFRWFRSDRELWVLDLKKWTKDFLDAGLHVPEPDPSERFGIPIVDEKTADRFLTEMRAFEVEKGDLAKELAVRFSGARSWWDVSDLFPKMFVDFDRRSVCAFYQDGIRMERYIPDGWTGEFEDFATKYTEERFPQHERFWIDGKIDMLSELNERGKRLTARD